MGYTRGFMPITRNELKENTATPKELGVEKTPFLASTERSAQATSVGLSKDLANSLMGLIRDVNKEGVTPDTVNASCNAAAQIYKILRLNYDMKKEGF